VISPTGSVTTGYEAHGYMLACGYGTCLEHGTFFEDGSNLSQHWMVLVVEYKEHKQTSVVPLEINNHV
jgi:hypothetical protein